MARAEVERDTACHDASMASMDADAAGSARAKVESELSRVQNALAVAEEARWKAEDEAGRLADERVSLLLELRTCKDEVSAIRAEALKEKEALKEAYEEGLYMIFNYGYGCCAFAHNICRSQPEVPDEMLETSKPLSPEFLLTLDAPQVLSLPKLLPSMFILVKQRMRQIGRLSLQFLKQIRVSISLPLRSGQVMRLILLQE